MKETVEFKWVSIYFPRVFIFPPPPCDFFFIQSVKAENEPESSQISTNSLIKLDNLVKPRRQAVSEASALIPGYVVFVILMTFFPVPYWERYLHSVNAQWPYLQVFMHCYRSSQNRECFSHPESSYMSLCSQPGPHPKICSVLIYCHRLVSLHFIHIHTPWAWLLSPHMFWGFVCAVEYIRCLSLFVAEYCFMWTYHNVFIWVAFPLPPLQVKVLWTLLYVNFCGHIFLFLLSKNTWRVELLGHMVSMCLTLKQAAK